MPDTGDEHVLSHRVRRIRASDLRVECQKCGGTGDKLVRSIERRTIIIRRVGHCSHCEGMVHTKPRHSVG